MNSQFAYDKMDYYSVLEYLKTQAKYFSNGVWTDFSDADIGTVILKLMAMNTDTTNYQVEKGISELYIDTVVERSNAVALCKLIGYEPRHFESAIVDLTIEHNGFNPVVLPAFTAFSNKGRDILYYNLDQVVLRPGKNIINVYEGKYIKTSFEQDSITTEGTIDLETYNIGVNTFKITQGGNIFKHINNALYGESEACYSVHLSSENSIYIQLPPYWSNFVTNTPVVVECLLSSGVEGRIGSNILSGSLVIDGQTLNYYNESASEGGFNPETVKWCVNHDMPVIPGVATPGEIEQAMQFGLTYLKLFPVTVLGGTDFLKALKGPYPQIKFMVSGGVNEQNWEQFLSLDNVFAVSGSWLAK